MRSTNLRSWLGRLPGTGSGRAAKMSRRSNFKVVPALHTLEDRTVMNGYLAMGAGAGAPPLVAIRIDRIAALTTSPTPIPLGGSGPLGGVTPPASDGTTDTTTQIFLAYDQSFRGGVHVTTGNFRGFTDLQRFDSVTGQQISGPDGRTDAPDYLVTAPGPGGGPDIKIWKMREDINGNIFVDRLVTQFMAYDVRFRGGVNVATGDLDGDGRAELILGAGPGGGPHVKIYKFDVSDQQMVLVNQFMAYEPTFRGGVSVSSGQGYRTTTIVQQVLGGPHPNNFTETPYPAAQGVPKPGEAEGVPLSGTTIDPATLTIRGTFTVASGAISYVGANLLNNYGNVAYTPNVEDFIPPNFDDFPQEFPLVYATWPATSMRRPAFMPADVPIGPFIRLPDAGTTPVVKPLTAGPGSVHFRNQLVTGPGPGGGPLVRVWDFVNNGTGGLQLNARIEFVGGDIASRAGIHVAIGAVVENAQDTGATVTSDRTQPTLSTLTFPYSTSVYSTFQPAIIVTPASGGGPLLAFADTVDADLQGRVNRKTTISQLNMRPVNLKTVSVVDPNNPLGPLLPPAGFPSSPGGNYFSTVDIPQFNDAIDPQYRGEMLAAVSALLFNGDGASARAQYVVAAGGGQNQPNRGPRVRIFDNLGTLIPQNDPIFGGFPVLPNTTVGNQNPYFPIDDFIAFTAGSFPGGVGGVAFGFGLLPMPTTDLVLLPPKPAQSVSDPIYIPPDPQPT
jgi:hypothetical protein